MARILHTFVVALLCAASCPAQQRTSAYPPQRPAARPIPVKAFRGRYCASYGPAGWAVIAENAQRVAFGADFMSGDGTAYAGYSIFGGGNLGIRGSETPDRAVATSLTNFGQTPTRFGNRRQMGPNVFLVEYQSATNHGVAFYQVIPAGPGGFMVVMRTAGTGSAPGLFERRGAEAMAVARAIRCLVPNVPPAPDPPGLHGANRSNGGGQEGDSLYNRWLDREYYHDPQTGENYWVSPSSDWSNTGPDGGGYYVGIPNGVRKLEPGYSQ